MMSRARLYGIWIAETPENVIRAMLTANGGEGLELARLVEDGWLR